MPRNATRSAAPFLPERRSLAALRQASKKCKGCPLYRRATQTVFGAGLARARVLLVGEQPGDQEDKQGKPFVGPAGRVLDVALREAGIPREDAYVTNVVKHFKWAERGKRRIHQKPNSSEIRACRPWLDAELDAVRPDVIVCLGATAAQALLGRDFRVSRQRGRAVPSALAAHAVATVHPSSILRQETSEDRERAMAELVADLKVVAKLLQQRSS